MRTKGEKNFEKRVKQGLEIVKREAIKRRVKRVGKRYSMMGRGKSGNEECCLCNVLYFYSIFFFLLCIYFFSTTIRMSFLCNEKMLLKRKGRFLSNFLIIEFH